MIRAEAYYHLACMSYMMANYGKAEAYCKEACNLDKRVVCGLLRAVRHAQ